MIPVENAKGDKLSGATLSYVSFVVLCYIEECCSELCTDSYSPGQRSDVGQTPGTIFFQCVSHHRH